MHDADDLGPAADAVDDGAADGVAAEVELRRFLIDDAGTAAVQATGSSGKMLPAIGASPIASK